MILGDGCLGNGRCLASPARHARGDAPQTDRLALLMFRISSRISGATPSRPRPTPSALSKLIQYRLNGDEILVPAG